MGSKPRNMLGAGAPAPTFELKDLDGNKQSLEGLLARGPVLLVFFKVSCPVCQLSAPYLSRLAANVNLQVVGISQDDEDSTEGFNQRRGVTFPVLLDEGRKGYPASNSYGIQTVPSAFLVEPDGLISLAFTGFSKRDLEAVGQRVGVVAFLPSENVPQFRAG